MEEENLEPYYDMSKQKPLLDFGRGVSEKNLKVSLRAAGSRENCQ